MVAKGMRKLGKTIWAGIIGGLITGILGMAAVLLSPFIKPGPPAAPVVFAEQKVPSLTASQIQLELNTIRKLITLPKGKPSKIEIGTFDFVGGRDNKEGYFVVTYASSGVYYGIYTHRTGIPELLFYEKGDLFTSIGFQPFYVNDRAFVLNYSVAGSAAVMNGWILEYDGIRSPHTSWTLPELADGFFFFQGNKLMLRGNNMRYGISYNKGSFSLTRYPERYDGMSRSVHVQELTRRKIG
jgi:hypothetical protein